MDRVPRTNARSILIVVSFLAAVFSGCAQPDKPRAEILRTVVDLAAGDTVTVELYNGQQVTLALLSTEFVLDPFRDAVRRATAIVDIDGERVVIESGNYNLPVTVDDVRIDCPVTKAYYRKTNQDRWGLDADARLRLWPAEGPLLEPGTFGYPVEQRFLANDTQMSNEPCYVNGCEVVTDDEIYYHSGLDFGGSEGLTPVLAATRGLVVCRGDSVLAGHAEDTPVMPRYDVVYVVDERGWYYRYSHLHGIDGSVVLGDSVNLGQRIGMIGKEGGSGGWSHLHFEIKARQPSGRWGTEEGYAYTLEAYVDRYSPELIAVARPHDVVQVGAAAELDGSRTWQAGDGELRFRWLLANGDTVAGMTAEVAYDNPGTYYEVLEVTDPAGNVDYDFRPVNVLDATRPELAVPMLHVNYYPSLDIRPGREITFKARTFNARRGTERWDFGDGASGTTSSVPCWGESWLAPEGEGNPMLHPDGYDTITHSYDEPGNYLVTVRRTTEDGLEAVARVHVAVGMGN